MEDESDKKKIEEEVEVCGWYMQVDLGLNLSLMCKAQFFLSKA